MLENQTDYDEREAKEMSYRTSYNLHLESSLNKKKKRFSFLSQLNFGDFVTEMLGTACTGLVLHTESVNQSKSAGQ